MDDQVQHYLQSLFGLYYHLESKPYWKYMHNKSLKINQIGAYVYEVCLFQTTCIQVNLKAITFCNKPNIHHPDNTTIKYVCLNIHAYIGWPKKKG